MPALYKKIDGEEGRWMCAKCAIVQLIDLLLPKGNEHLLPVYNRVRMCSFLCQAIAEAEL